MSRKPSKRSFMDVDEEEREEEEATTIASMKSTSRLSCVDADAGNYASDLLVCRPPEKFVRPPGVIPFHIPHKKLLEKLDERTETQEPLTGFKEAQLSLLRKRRDSGESVSKRFRGDRTSDASLVKRKQAIVLPHHRIPNIVHQQELINKVRQDKVGTFVYLIYAVPRSSEHYTPYALIQVPYERINKKNFLTMSCHGVLQHRMGEQTFTNLDKWEAEYKMYCRLMRIKSLFHFRSWKAFYVWRKNVLYIKFEKAKKNVATDLFILNVNLREALLRIQSMIYYMLECSYVDVSAKEDKPLFYFIEAQMMQMEELQAKILEFRSVTKEILFNACTGALLARGFIVDETKEPKDRKSTRKVKISYIEQANKKNYCIRLNSFVILVDYMRIDLLHKLMDNSTRDLLNIFRSHVSYTPKMDLLRTRDTDKVFSVERPSDAPKSPLFPLTLLIYPDNLALDPSLTVAIDILRQVVDLWYERSTSMRSFIGDAIFKPFTNPMINGKMEDRLCGLGPPLYFYLEEDHELKVANEAIFATIKEAYAVADIYIERFETIREFFAEDCLKEAQSIKDERDLVEFRNLCTRYNDELELIDDIIEWQPLGLLSISMSKLKRKTRPQPVRLLEVLKRVLPTIGKTKIDQLITDADETEKYLSTEPTATVEFVNFIEYIESASGRVDNMETVLEYCKELYDIMEEFKIPIPEVDMTNYLSVSVTLGNLRNFVDKKVEEKVTYVKKLAERLLKDVSELIVEIGNIRDQSSQSWLYDIDSSMEEVMTFLDGLYKHLQDCQTRAAEFRNYQKQFRLEVTRLDILDEVIAEVKLRMLLWESTDAWTKTTEEWYTCDFDQLNPEEMNLFTAKTLKNVTQLEKGIPKNMIVPKLRDQVELLKDKLQIITYLRNPALRNRHWLRVENVLNYKFKGDEVVTLTLLEELKVFNYPEEITDISGQASSEYGLELLLKKIEDTWNDLEYIVLPHKDAKDVYILGTLEEIQVALDESNINVATILSSRHVGPIKPRVEEWARMLEQFAKTLDEWSNCQQQWMYLEIIFSAPDIQRQLPNEAKMFLVVDKNWKEIMRRTHKVPLAMEATLYPGLLDTLKKNNALLEQIMKCLESYLETKRVAFPRFYFLSNDELLDILAQTRNPFAVQPHLRKCFDAIAKLEFGVKEDENNPGVQTMTTDIMAMISPEGERVRLTKGLKARGNVEDWLSKVEESMFLSLKKQMKFAVRDYVQRTRESWVVEHPNQIVLTVSQIMWARGVHEALDKSGDKVAEMMAYEKKCINDLNNLAGVIRGNLTDVTRKVLIALITIDVHARDTISNMIKNRVSDSNNFEWLKMLRYYWDNKLELCVAKMSSTSYNYKYEYLGAGGVLVITPLTDKCYLCLMGALQLDLGGAPAGPAGTGKTETTKDLAKAMAVQCVVFNCSEGLDYKMMGRFFSGLAQSGAWCCFDEFNRIDIEVLSVIAQQLITIRNAKAARVARFMFEGREIKLTMTCAAFITMNPGYAGRTELPDNLKSLFRPISMMVPDYALIAEVVLYSEGFESSKLLAHKMVQMYKLCSEQLSQQDHYDFGMRAVKSVLVMAGALKRSNPDKSEDVVLICALRDSNLPKFLAEDAVLFKGILNDLFPGVDLPEQDYGVLQTTIVAMMEEQILQPEACMIKKVIQLYETMIVRWGVMLVGPTGGGKTSVLNTLNKTLTKMYDDGFEGKYYRPVRTYTMNPKAVTAGELYGEVNPFTMEWRDGLMGIMVRTAVNAENDDHQWVVCDGPVDAVWIENLNTVLDDNKMLCLANSERIKLTPYVHMVFEVMDLAQASPATVSRCGMVYVDSDEIKYLPYVRSWLQKFDENLLIPEMKEFMLMLFETYMEDAFNFVKKRGTHAIHQVDISKVMMCCSIIDSILHLPGATEKIGEKSKVRNFLCQTFIYAYMWGLGGNLTDVTREKFEAYVRDQFEEHPDAKLPTSHDLWSMYVSIPKHRLAPFAKVMPAFDYTNEIPFFDLLVPTLDTERFGTVMELLLKVDHPVLFTGDTGVGKSVIARHVLDKMQRSNVYVPITLNFSAQTSSFRTQEILELKLEKRKKTLLGAPIGKRVVIFVDDINMPKLETYGAQPPIELLRQLLDYGGLYDREKLFWKDITDVVLAAACAPPGGGRNPLTPRFVRHFGMMLIPPPNEAALKVIFKSIMKGFLNDFSQDVIDLGEPMVNAAVEIYQRIAEDLLPTPAKSHYVFNLRDLSKCIQGILQADSGTMRDAASMMRLFYYECLRVFHDRLINIEDKSYFYYLMKEVCLRYFSNAVLQLPDTPIIQKPPLLLFGDFMVPSAEFRIYEEIRDLEKLISILKDYMDDYNITNAKDMRLIFFMDAIEHCTRIARILRAERGNALLVGLGGMGKQSLTKLASHVNGYKCCQIELTRTYDHGSFFEDLRKMYFSAGCNLQDTVFLFTDNQIVQEEFLEDINNMLNSGEVPNLFESDELERVIIATRPRAKEMGIAENNRDKIYEYFISKVRSKLHLVICMSPVGDAFRRRCRMFPSLVNCCTIDWFMKWPEDALLSVAESDLKSIADDELTKKLAKICVTIHASVESTTVRFYEEMRRHYYTTPSNYLEILKLYKAMLEKKKQDINKRINRVANGLTKLYETNSVIDSMKEALQAMEPELAKKSAAVAELMKYLATETKEADKVRSVVKKDEDEAKAKADECQALADDAQKDLDVVLPAMELATKALEALNKNDINEIRVFQKPPEMVKFVMESVCLLLGSKTDWQSAKLMMGDTNFLKKLQEYDKDHISEGTLKKLKDYIDNKNFMPEIVAKVSKVCKSICQWVRAIDTYAKVYKVVAPKKLKVEGAEKELNTVMTLLREKQRKLAEVEAVIAGLEAKYNKSLQEKQVLEDDMALTSARLTRAGRLNIALGDEQTRWEQTIEDAKSELGNLIGDVLVAAASVAYLGAFTSSYRADLVNLWLKECKVYKIPSSETYSLIEVLADPYDIRMWNTCGLPRDSVSTENAIIVTKAGRWPLMIDPQEQANRWIRNMETPHSLKLIKLTDANFMRILESAIRIGLPVLLEEVGETLDPVLAPILLKQTFVQGGRTLIHLGDSDIEYDENFRFYITTKLSNPHYLPEICIQATIVNFTVTPSGLEDQLLVDVVRLERPDLEQQRTELIVRINTDKQSLKNIEDKILKLLYQSEGNILDDEELIDTLNESKETSAIIAARLIETEATEEKISIAREKYRTVATRGSVLYFVVAQLSEIDPMYQYSLKYFNQIFNTVIETSEKSDDLQVRLNTLYDQITLAVYTNVSRGLFERHKLVFSFMLCVAVLTNAGIIKPIEYNYLLRGAIGTKLDEMKKPDDPAITDLTWLGTIYLTKTFSNFQNIRDDVLRVITVSVGDYVQTIRAVPQAKSRCKNDWNEILTDFEKLMLIKTFQEEKLVFAITAYVKNKLGQAFIESPQVSLNLLYQGTSNVTPLIFILSTGSDPFSAFQRFAAEMGFRDKILSISLGQGQGPVAEKLMDAGTVSGQWVFLQNCHLATSWMLPMERIIQSIAQDSSKIHPTFRLYLSSMPSKSFPVSVLQNSVKVTNEPPKGLRANIKRAFTDMQEDFFEDHPLEQDWRTMLFGICMFHAIIQERKKFGPLGWNITYEFNDSDREFAFNTLKMFCAEGYVPWDALEYITGEITYGGRVTDYWDLRCLKTILKIFFSPPTLDIDWKYSQSGVYYCPRLEKLANYRNFIDGLPIIEEPEIFGMHENANIAYQSKETRNIVLTILDSQPRVSGGSSDISADEIVYELSQTILEKIMKRISTDDALPLLFQRDDKGRYMSLTTVLTQEVDRYNKLLKLIHGSMENLQKAIKGLVVMSDDLEEVFKSFLNNQIPRMWSAKSYPSLKSLGSWVHDLELRLDFIVIWLRSGHPTSYWISGFYFPQGFITGTLQTHARKYNLPIDQLKFDFFLKGIVIDQEDVKAAHDVAEVENYAVYSPLISPEDGVLVHGLYLDAGRWDMQQHKLVDPFPGEMNPPLPALLFLPVTRMPEVDPRYVSPLYKTSVRAGTLSTTGHSTNFVLSVLLPSSQPQSYWILKGTALLTQLTN